MKNFLRKLLLNEEHQQDLNEGKIFPEDIIKKIAKLTDNNNHGDARVLAAKTMKAKDLLAAYEGTKNINKIFGDATFTMDARNKLDKMMFHRLEKEYENGKEVYKAF